MWHFKITTLEYLKHHTQSVSYFLTGEQVHKLNVTTSLFVLTAWCGLVLVQQRSRGGSKSVERQEEKQGFSCILNVHHRVET